MTAAELIAKLESIPPETTVYVWHAYHDEPIDTVVVSVGETTICDGFNESRKGGKGLTIKTPKLRTIDGVFISAHCIGEEV